MQLDAKLTAQIAVKYFGAKCKYYDEVFTMWGLNRNRIWKADDGSGTMPIGECKLILTPLTEMTDADAIEVAKILDVQYSNTNEDYWFDLAGLAEHLQETLSGSDNTMYEVSNIMSLIDYLRSRFYDVDNLIGTVAVDGTPNEKV